MSRTVLFWVSVHRCEPDRSGIQAPLIWDGRFAEAAAVNGARRQMLTPPGTICSGAFALAAAGGATTL